jgi:hypothetical protein
MSDNAAVLEGFTMRTPRTLTSRADYADPFSAPSVNHFHKHDKIVLAASLLASIAGTVIVLLWG